MYKIINSSYCRECCWWIIWHLVHWVINAHCNSALTEVLLVKSWDSWLFISHDDVLFGHLKNSAPEWMAQHTQKWIVVVLQRLCHISQHYLLFLKIDQGHFGKIDLICAVIHSYLAYLESMMKNKKYIVQKHHIKYLRSQYN